MFTGLIAATGTVVEIHQPEERSAARQITIALPVALAGQLRTGDSIAVSGVCLTALRIRLPEPGSTATAQFGADLAQETIARTSLARLAAGAVVNLELPTPAGTPLGGHIVQGHVDGVGELLSLEAARASTHTGSAGSENAAATDWVLRLRIPTDLTRYVANKGSIAVEGISLTVARLEQDIVTIAVIPHTWSATNLHTLAPGAPLNIEVDILAKYAEQRARSTASSLSLEYLVANGY